MGGTEVVGGYSGSDRVSNDDRSGYGDIKGGGNRYGDRYRDSGNKSIPL